MAPGHNRSIAQQRSKCAIRCLEVPHILQLPLDSAAITSKVRSAPGNNKSIASQCSKCARRSRKVNVRGLRGSVILRKLLLNLKTKVNDHRLLGNATQCKLRLNI